MKKIAIITLHRVRNYGSSLQTLALQEIIKSKGFEVEVIDYYPERYTSFGLLKRLKNKSEVLKKNPVLLFGARVIISFSYLKKKIVFDSFLKNNINLTPKTYRSEKELLENPIIADAYCTGSDQVWNSLWNEGIDAPLYLSFIDENKYKFSYAASIGNSSIDQEEGEIVKKYLASYNHLSVREDSGVNILKELGFENVIQVLDPTLLLDASGWERFTSNRYSGQKYVLTYNLHHDPKIDKYANEIAKKYNLEVFNISYNWHDIYRKGKLKWCPKIEEYLGLIKNAQYVVTDSFHATVFSLIFHRNFVVIYPEHASSRLRSILKQTNLEIRGADEMPDIELVNHKIPFDNVDEKLKLLRQESISFLDKVLGEIKNL